MASSFSDIPKEKLLESIRIAAPCKADWNAMTGDERVRFCGQCKLNVRVQFFLDGSQIEIPDFDPYGFSLLILNCPTNIRRQDRRARNKTHKDA